MGSKKVSAVDASADAATDQTTGDLADQATGDATTSDSGPSTPATVVTPPTPDADQPADDPIIPDPIVAIGPDGEERPMSGGSFIRQDNGTLIRNPEA